MPLLTMNGLPVLLPGSSASSTYMPERMPDYLCFTALQAKSTVELTQVGTRCTSYDAYSRDGYTWTSFVPSTTAGTNKITLTNVGDKVYFRSTLKLNLSLENYRKFVMTGKIAASGNCNSMYIAEGFEELDELTYQYCYNSMFLGCTSLTTAPSLPATTLSSSCYHSMFSGCTSLQVSDTQTTAAQNAWRIPTSGTFTNTTAYNQSNMFASCKGSRSSNTMSGVNGESHTYYTQNQPV